MRFARLTAALAAGALAASGMAACGNRESRDKSNPGDVPAGGGNTVETNPTTLGSTTPKEKTVTQAPSSPTEP